jgi:hypothetical protein
VSYKCSTSVPAGTWADPSSPSTSLAAHMRDYSVKQEFHSQSIEAVFLKQCSSSRDHAAC